jgi:hypothetical protein
MVAPGDFQPMRNLNFDSCMTVNYADARRVTNPPA